MTKTQAEAGTYIRLNQAMSSVKHAFCMTRCIDLKNENVTHGIGTLERNKISRRKVNSDSRIHRAQHGGIFLPFMLLNLLLSFKIHVNLPDHLSRPDFTTFFSSLKP